MLKGFRYRLEFDLLILEKNHKIYAITTHENYNYILEETSLIKMAARQLDEYFKGERQQFNLPLDLSGTTFQTKVWKELLKIPYGQTKSYKDIAIAINNPKAYRAVGMANNKNRIMIVVPCHRVISSDNKLTGYAGGLEKKEFLLNLEYRYYACNDK